MSFIEYWLSEKYLFTVIVTSVLKHKEVQTASVSIMSLVLSGMLLGRNLALLCNLRHGFPTITFGNDIIRQTLNNHRKNLWYKN